MKGGNNMKYIPHALTVTVIGLLLLMRGMVSEVLWLRVIGGIVTAAGVIWYYYGHDKLMQHIKAEKRRQRRVDKLETACGNADLIARAADLKADEAKAAARTKGQHIKGFVRDGDRIINFERKEAL